MKQLGGDSLLGLSQYSFQKQVICQPQYRETEALKNGKLLTMAGVSGGICNGWRFLGSCSKGYTLPKHRDGK